MINYGKVKSSIKPKNMVIDKFSIWINENIEKKEVSIREKTYVEYEYDMFQYDKDEFILMQSQQLIDTQLALCEIYEGMEV